MTRLICILTVAVSVLLAPFALNCMAEELPTKSTRHRVNIKNVKQYYVRNSNEGVILVIEGKAWNEAGVPIESIELEYKLFGDNDVLLTQCRYPANGMLTFSSLSKLDGRALTKWLTRGTPSGVISPHDHAAFMVVFLNPPENLNEYLIEVVQAHPVK